MNSLIQAGYPVSSGVGASSEALNNVNAFLQQNLSQHQNNYSNLRVNITAITFNSLLGIK